MEVIYILRIIFLLAFLTQHNLADEACQLTIDDCDYHLRLSPKGICHRKEVKDFSRSRSRSRRSACENAGNVSNDIVTVSTKVDKLNKKITKEMRHLSTRVLRGVRRVETMVSDLISRQPRRSLRNPEICPTGFVGTDNWRSCYMFSTFDTTWYEARDFCSALDSEMVSLGTLKEHYIVTYLIKNNDEIRNAEAWWTSGQFVSKAKQWMWTSDTELRPFSFIKWAVSEPNESSLQCVMLFSGDNHLWHDQLCTDKYNFICEFTLK